MEGMATLLAALGIAFAFGWQLALTVLPFLPLMVICGMIQNKISLKFAKGDRDASEQAGQVSLKKLKKIKMSGLYIISIYEA